MDEYYRAVKALPAWRAAPLAQLPAQTAVRVQELRLRIGRAVTFTVQGRQCAASVLPGCPPALAAMRLDALQIEEIFYTLCNGSVHTHERELAEGYLTTAAGNRVGVAGQFVQREGQSIALQKVTSLNLRIARSCAICLPPELVDKHLARLSWAWLPVQRNYTFPGCEGQDVEVNIYADADEVELLLNGRSLGRKPCTEAQEYLAVFRFAYEPGTLEAVSYNNGAVTGRDSLATGS